jgi:hypothetical protein
MKGQYKPEYYRQHRERILAQQRKWRLTHQEHDKERKRQYWENNKDRYRAYQRSYYAKWIIWNRERRRENLRNNAINRKLKELAVSEDGK